MTTKSAGTLMKQRAGNELKFHLTIDAPDDEGGGRHQIDVDLRTMTLGERELARAALAKAAQPPAFEVVLLVHAWVVWRRTHPTSSLQVWMDDITFGEIVDGLNLAPGRVAFDTTPEGFDPEA